VCACLAACVLMCLYVLSYSCLREWEGEVNRYLFIWVHVRAKHVCLGMYLPESVCS
jgi:hypothetical protein